MKKLINKSKKPLLGLMIGLLFLGSVVVFAKNGSSFPFVNAKPAVNVVLSGTVERNSEKLSLGKAEAVQSGEVLQWTISSENKGDGEAKNYKVVGKIPVGTEFVAESAKAEGAAKVLYSLDGKEFSAQPMIEEKQADGSVKSVPAPTSMYKQLRFEWENSLNPKEKLNAFYEVKVK
ncbi:MAG: hypothetical protein HC846_02625 [Blastocatellia bacterium]|nr:hypothetical protein [Blastocatellia bacterium]